MNSQKSCLRLAKILRFLALSLAFLLGFRAIGAGAFGNSERQISKKPTPRDFTDFRQGGKISFNAIMAPKPLVDFDGKAFYGKHCKKCHGADGAGAEGKETFPEIPDFTSKGWQMERADAELEVSILEGKGKGMPPFGDKLRNEQAEILRDFVRAFAKSR